MNIPTRRRRLRRLQSLDPAQVAAGFSHRVGRRPLCNPSRDGEVSHPGLAAAGGGELGDRAGQPLPASRFARRTIRRLRRIAGANRLDAVSLSHKRGPVHRGTHARGQAGCLFASVHPSFVRRGVRQIRKRAVLSLSPRVVQPRRAADCGPADPAAAASATSAARRPDLRHRDWRRDESPAARHHAVCGHAGIRGRSRRVAVMAVDAFLWKRCSAENTRRWSPPRRDRRRCWPSMPDCCATSSASTATPRENEVERGNALL